MKKHLITLLILLSCIALHAQDVDGGATKIMQELATKYKNFTTIQIQYTLKIENESTTLETFNGMIAMKGILYKMTLPEQALFCDGTSTWNYNESVNEVSIFEFDDQLSMNPIQMITNWEHDFRAKFIREEFENNKALQIIDLSPITKQSYYKVRVFIDKAKKEVIRCKIFEKDNTFYSFFIDKATYNQNLTDDFFKFDNSKHPNVEVNDMR